MNTSSRALVQTGHNVLLGGFIITGTQNKRGLLRAIGPSLTLSGKLMDPVLRLHNGRGALIATNDNWVDASNRQDIANTIIAQQQTGMDAMAARLNEQAAQRVSAQIELSKPAPRTAKNGN